MTVPARSPVDDALDRLGEHRPSLTGAWIKGEHRIFGQADQQQFDAALATVRAEVERLREAQVTHEHVVALMAAEAENRRLTELADWRLEQEEHYRAEVGRLGEGLRELRETAAPRAWETPGHPMNDWTKREPILRKIDALLAGSPADAARVPAGEPDEGGEA